MKIFIIVMLTVACIAMIVLCILVRNDLKTMRAEEKLRKQ